MAAEGAISEALARVEHKIDLLLELLARAAGPDAKGSWVLTQVGDQQHICPVCTLPAQYQVEFMNKVVARKCGCSTGKQAPINLDAFAPPAQPVRQQGGSDGNGDQEDRGYADHRGGGGRR